ncbi:MAG: hypothetical protein FWE27_09490 [Defluviitaleaceae bacterium]|nr:hypothetical protein [Defluviitaleaceae bacterium]
MDNTIYNFEAMRSVDIRTVDPSTLVDIRDVNVNPNLPFTEKVLDYLNQIKNAYCFRFDNVIVKISHTQTETTLEDCMEGFYRSL